ncbi:MAG: hypothetical protein J0H30_01035 [Alphaproteobacteria bacterium]|nr:hypothetical protein [Alphaproteobacteria bacterium]
MRDFRGIAASLLLSACVIPISAANAASAAKPALGQWGVDLTSMDTAIKPGDDFFEYVNGTWLKTAKIPDDRASTGSFQDLRIQSEKQMRAIVGLEIEIAEISGKWKVSQNRPAADREGVVAGLRASTGKPNAAPMADLVERYSEERARRERGES